MPHALEFPRMLRAVVPLVCAHLSFVREHVALSFGHSIRAHQIFWFGSGRIPGFAAIIRPLDDLPKPSARLRRKDAIGINGRAFEMIHLPTREVWPADLPVLPLAIRRQNKCTFFR